MFNSRGEHRMCHNEDQVRAAKQDGFTSPSYVRTVYPKCFYHKKTGETKLVGRVDWSAAQNKEAETALGPDWTTDFVGTPEAKPEKPAATAADSLMLAEILLQLKSMDARLGDLEAASAETTEARVALESRLSEMESVLTQATEPQPQ